METLTVSFAMIGVLELMIILALTLGLLVVATGAIVAIALIVRGNRGKQAPAPDSSTLDG